MFIKHHIQLYTIFACKLSNLNVTEKIFDIFLIVNAYIIFVGQLFASQVQKTQYLSLDYLIMSAIKYTHFTNTLREGLLFDEHKICITVSAFHITIISLYAIIGKFYEKYSHTRTIDSIILILSYFHKVYIWAMVVPSLSYLFYYIMTHYDSKFLCFIACISSILSIIYALIILKSNGFLDFFPKNPLCIRNSHALNIFYCGQVALSILEFFKETLPLTISIILHSMLNIILACILIRLYWIDLPYPDSTISKAYGFMNFYLIYLTTLILVSIFFADKLSHVWLFLLMGGLFTYQLSRTLRKNIKSRILTISDYNELSKCRFDYLVRKIKKYLDPSASNKIKSMFYLTLFIRSHVLNCTEIMCICHSMRLKANKDDNSISKQVFDSIDFIDKAEIMYTCKKLILELIQKLFNKSYCKKNPFISSADIDMHILHMQYLLDEQRYYESYIESMKLKELGAKLNERHVYQIKQTQYRLCNIILEGTHIKDRYKFQDIILQQDLTNHLKDQLFKLFENYEEFYQKLHENVVNIELIIQKANIILKLRKKIVKIANLIYEIEPLSLETKKVWNAYLNLHIVRDQKYQLEDISYQLLKKNHMGLVSSILHSNILVDLYDQKSCIMFINITHKKFGEFIMFSQDVTQIFGYAQQELKMRKIDVLMPVPYLEVYKNYFLDNVKADTQTKNVYLPEIFGIEKEEFLIALEAYFKIEPLYNDLTAVLWVKKLPRENSMILTDTNGYMINHTKSLQDFIQLKSNSRIHLGFLIPSKILDFVNRDLLAEISKEFIASNRALTEIISSYRLDSKNSNLLDTNYLILPKSFSKLTFSKGIHKLLIGPRQEAIDQNRQSLLIKALAKIYSSYHFSNVKVYKISGVLREHKFESIGLDLKLLEFNENVLEMNNMIAQNVLNYYKRLLRNLCQIFEGSRNVRTSERIWSAASDLTVSDENSPRYSVLSAPRNNFGEALRDIPENKFSNESDNEEVKSNDYSKSKHSIQNLCLKEVDSSDVIPVFEKLIKRKNNHKISQEKQQINENNSSSLSNNIDTLVQTKTMNSPKIRTRNHSVETSNITTPRNLLTFREEAMSRETEQCDRILETLEENDDINDKKLTNMSKLMNASQSFIKVNEDFSYQSKAIGELNDQKKLGKQLADTNMPKLFQQIKSVVLAALILLLAILIFASVFWVIYLNSYKGYLEIYEFPAKSSAIMSLFYNVINIHLLAQDNMFKDQNSSKLLAKGHILQEILYSNYKEIYTKIILNDANEDKLHLLDIKNMTISLLKADDEAQDYILTFTSSMTYLLQQTNSAIIKQSGVIYENDSTVYFFRKNHPLYFNSLLNLTNQILKQISSNQYQFSNENLNLLCMITSIVIVFIILVIIFPLWRYIQKIKISGLMFLTLYSPHDLNIYLMEIRTVKAMLNELDVEKIEHHISLNHKSKYIDRSNNQKKQRRKIKYSKKYLIGIIIAIILMISSITTFFIFKYFIEIDRHHDIIDLLTNSYNFSNQYSNLHARFATAFQALTLYNADSIWREFYNSSYKPIFKYFDDSISSEIRFFDNLDEFIGQTQDMQEFEIEKYWKLKWGNLCDFITIYPMTYENLTECKTAYKEAMKYGFTSLLYKIYDGFKSQYNSILKANYSRDMSYHIINDEDIDLTEMNNLLYYMTLVFLEMMEIIQQGTNDILKIHLRNSIIFGGVEVILVFILGIMIWYLLFQKLKNEILSVKKVYCILPIELINNSNNIKQWLDRYK